MVMGVNKINQLQQNEDETLEERLKRSGVSRRGFLKFCAATAAAMALPPSMAPAIAAALGSVTRPSVIWLSFKNVPVVPSPLPGLICLRLKVLSLMRYHSIIITRCRLRQVMLLRRPENRP